MQQIPWPESKPQGPRGTTVQELALAFARELARNGRRSTVVLVTPDNKLVHHDGRLVRVTIPGAVASGQAFAIAPHPWLLPIDDDANPHSPAGALDGLVTDMEAEGLVPVVVNSGGGHGRRHVFVLIPNDSQRARYAERARALHLDVRDAAFIRPPYAPHRRGGRSEVINMHPLVALAALSPVAPGAAIPDAGHLPPLSKRMRKLRRVGSEPGQRDRSRCDLAFAVGAVAAGIKLEGIRSVFADARNGIGQHYRNHAKPEHYLAATYARASARVAMSPRPIRPDPNGVRDRLAALQHLADRHDWTGPGMASLRVLLQAHLDIATAAASFSYSATIAQLAQRSGLADRTVQGRPDRGGNRQLAALGWLEIAPTRAGKTTTFRLIERQALVGSGTVLPNSPTPPPGTSSLTGIRQNCTAVPTDHDAFAHWKSGWQLCSLLAKHEPRFTNAVDIATEMGWSPRMGRRHLQQARDAGLVVVVDGMLAYTGDLDGAVRRRDAMKVGGRAIAGTGRRRRAHRLLAAARFDLANQAWRKAADRVRELAQAAGFPELRNQSTGGCLVWRGATAWNDWIRRQSVATLQQFATTWTTLQTIPAAASA